MSELFGIRTEQLIDWTITPEQEEQIHAALQGYGRRAGKTMIEGKAIAANFAAILGEDHPLAAFMLALSEAWPGTP